MDLFSILGIAAALIAVAILLVVVLRKKKPTESKQITEAPQEQPEALEQAVVTEAEPAAAPPEKDEESKEAARRAKRMEKLRQGLAPTRGGFITKLGSLFHGKKELDAHLMEQLEETMLTADVGVKTSTWFIELLKAALDKNELTDPEKVWDLLREEVRQVISIEAPPFDFSTSNPYVIMVVGVNGVGKTTTIGKIATSLTEQGHKVVLAAADTFRAAAVEQLTVWGERSGATVVKSGEGADPSSVVFDAVKKAKEIGADVVIADTAGRLHTKLPLMEELKKVKRVAGKAHEGAPHHVLLVLDATTGQNALQQTSMFKEALDGLSSIALTKLDGTAKGGVIIGICHEHNIPIRFIGIGEAKEDLRDFHADEFADALFYKEGI